MSDENKNIFRKKSLERLSSPERLDRLMQVVSPKEWLALASLGSILVVALMWSIFGRIPIVVTGRGIIIYPRRIVDLQSPVAGQLRDVRVKAGDCIAKNTVLADLDQPELQKQMQQQEQNLAELQRQDRQLGTLTQESSAVQLQALEKQRQTLKQHQENIEALAGKTQVNQIQAIEKQRQNLEERLKNARDLTTTLANRLKVRRDLKNTGAISSDVVLEAEQSYRDNLNQISDLSAQLQQLNVQEIQANQTYRDSQTQLSDLSAQLQEIDSKQKTLNQQNTTDYLTRANKIDDLKRSIAQLEVQLHNNSQIVSQQGGCILELLATPGQVVTAGVRLGSIRIDEADSQMVSLAYFTIKDGKKIQRGMSMQVTPDTVKREQFGGILGNVTEVSPFAVSKDEIVRDLGNTELAQSLAVEGGQIKILGNLELNHNTFSGYKWSSSKGPQLLISSGTPTSVRVTVEERAPITFVLPILKSATGIY